MPRPSTPTLIAVAALAGPALAAPSSGASPFKPGKWDIAVTIDDIKLQNGMAGVAAVLKGKTTHVTHCMTPAEAADGAKEMMSGKTGCSFPKHVMAGGHLSGETICHNGASTSRIAQDGAYTPVSFKIRSRAVESGGAMPMTMDMTQVGTRTGDC